MAKGTNQKKAVKKVSQKPKKGKTIAAL